MTSADIAELRDFISDELGKVHRELREVRKDQGRLEALSARHFVSIESRLGGVESRVGGVESRLTRVETAQEAMRSDFRAFGEDLRGTNRRLDELRGDMNRRFAEQHEQTRAAFAHWGDRVEPLERRVDDLEAGR